MKSAHLRYRLLSLVDMMSERQANQIRCNRDGLVVMRAGDFAASIAWTEVQTVLAYKRDRFTVDLMCLGFVTPNGTVEVNEDMQGWSDLAESLPDLLPGTPPFTEWWKQVAFPPFATSMTKLYERRNGAHLR